MRVVVVTGIYPPDIGGPAVHASDLVEELGTRGHEVAVVTLRDPGVTVTDRRVRAVSRARPVVLRMLWVAGWLVRHRHRYDVVYATGMLAEAVAGARLARRPVVAKVVGDPAWERSRRLGLTADGFETFQATAGGGARVRAMTWLRDWAVRSATEVVAPSTYLAGVARRWAPDRRHVTVIANGVRAPSGVPRSREPHEGRLRAVFVGRLVDHKHVDRLIEAVGQVPGVELDVVGDGPQRDDLVEVARRAGVAERARFPGSLDHDAVLDVVGRADVLLLASSYEGLPHVVIEALVCGTPVVAPDVGGTAEAVEHGTSGLIVPGDLDSFVDALTQLRDDPSLRERLAKGALEAGMDWRFEATADAVERLLRGLVAGGPRVVLVGQALLTERHGEDFASKSALLARHVRPVFVGETAGPALEQSPHPVLGVPTSRVPLGGVLFYASAPPLAVAGAALLGARAVLCQSPYEGLGVVAWTRLLPRRRRPLVVVEVHGEWTTATRMYGSGARRMISPLADRSARWALRRADAVRVISDALADRVRAVAPATELLLYPTYVRFAPFLAPVEPLPDAPTAVFIGALERVKGLDVLLAAWPSVQRAVPGARLVVLGDGGDRRSLVAGMDEGIRSTVDFRGHVSRDDVVDHLDAAWCLVMPSRSEGLGRAALEALGRARPVVASAVGGLPEVVDDGDTGLLVPSEDVGALADALTRVLGDRALAERLGRRGRRAAEQYDPERQYERGVARLASWIAGGGTHGTPPDPDGAMG